MVGSGIGNAPDRGVIDLDNILSLPWKHVGEIEEAIGQKIPKLLASDRAFQNACTHSDRENTVAEAELAIKRAMTLLLSSYLDLFTKFTQDSEFRAWLTSVVLGASERKGAVEKPAPFIGVPGSPPSHP